ncbi:tRNA pseudouridine(38-40) synthase TruA [Alkalihalobacillus berkeleyi]|uniref:tRNA pseudouridine synthase A n=2 Tax=Pseudalkalibacillus berkeleyi TaxID=1069813 RepID=A0ABS9H5P2_9BACL|nr:tRNA pseudouridine(38-40) synthase TruA [Pseudalkalibacillus berkeleyi]MCF6139441.1 tRNA pseudouridine(38-40) synthase TruA [Pseudalkalibacillus berkeleyi]
MSGIISYDGTNFSGYQVQPDQRTVQGNLEKVLQRMHKGEFVKVIASGRTDTGVHAVGQVFHFDTPLSIAPDGWKRALNTLLPDDIRLLSIDEVASSFHARYDVSAKEYQYRVLRADEEDVFRRNFTFHYPFALDIDQMRRAANYLIGEHDFTSFCSARTEVVDKTRTIYKLDISESGEELIFSIKGTGFLYNMVRIIVGTLLEIGNGRRSPEDIPDMLLAKDRDVTGKTAPGHGLYLWEVSYEKEE